MRFVQLMAAAGVGTVLSLSALSVAAHADTVDYTGPNVLGTSITQQPAPAPSVAATTQDRPASSSLPVTGGDIEVLAGVGVVTLAAGVVLTRRSRPRTD